LIFVLAINYEGLRLEKGGVIMTIIFLLDMSVVQLMKAK